mgnify:CR=1 FL=1
MIIISVGGGLGNQMFEYALYYKLKKLYPDQVIKLDIYYAFPEAHNGFEVEKIFNLQSEKASKEEVERLIDRLLVGEHESRICSLIREVRQRIGLKKKSYLLQRDYSAYYPEFFNLDRNQSYYLYGSFCNSLYFHDMKQEIQQLFTFPTLDEKNRKWREIINQNTCVSVHIRRGDYVSWNMGLCTEEYYKYAVSYIREKLEGKELVFLAFTDDPDYVKEEFGWLENMYIVEGNSGTDSYRDMQLMSLCEHNINANSTFSFWGAYLNQNPDKIVVAPKEPVHLCKCPFTSDGWVML